MTVQDILYDIRALLEEYTEDGVVIAPSEVADIEKSALRFINMGLAEISTSARTYSTFKITQTPTDEQKSAGKMLSYELPSDFYQMVEVVEDDSTRSDFAQYKLEAYRTLYLPSWFEGVIDVIYVPKLVRLTAYTDEIPTNNPIVEQFLTYYAAANVALVENPQNADYFKQTSIELKFQALKGQPATEQKITDVYFGG